MANSGSARRAGTGNRRSGGSGNRSANARRSGAPLAAKPAPEPHYGEAAGADRPSADERARDRLSQPRSGTKRPPSRGGPRPGGKIDPRKRRPQAHSTGKTAGLFGGTFVGLAVVIIILISLLGGSSGSTSKPVPYKPAPAAYVTAVTTVSAHQLAAAGVGGGLAAPSGVFVPTPKQAALKVGNKPELVYIGAEYCPFCAATRWPLVIALSRFGSFTGLGTVASTPYDVYASTRTFSFAKATYSSPYLVFSATELTKNTCAVAVVSNSCPNGNYTKLETPSPANAKLFSTYDSVTYFPSTPGGGGIPFLDWGGKYVSSGSLYAPNLINLGNSNNALGWHPMSWQQIIDNIDSKPLTPAGEAILGAANVYTGAICDMTHGRPGAICKAPVIKQAEAELKAT